MFKCKWLEFRKLSAKWRELQFFMARTYQTPALWSLRSPYYFLCLPLFSNPLWYIRGIPSVGGPPKAAKPAPATVIVFVSDISTSVARRRVSSLQIFWAGTRRKVRTLAIIIFATIPSSPKHCGRDWIGALRAPVSHSSLQDEEKILQRQVHWEKYLRV